MPVRAPPEALEAAEHAARLGPESQDALRVLTMFLRRLRRNREALAIDPLDDRAVQGLLQVSAAKGRVWRAVREESLLLGLDPRHKYASHLMHRGYLRAGVRVNFVAALCVLHVYVMGMLGLIQGPVLLGSRIIVTLLLFGLVAWPTVLPLTPSRSMRRHLSGFRGFRPWLAGLFLMAPAILFLGLVPIPWGLTGLALLLGAYVLQRVSRQRMREHIDALERTLR